MLITSCATKKEIKVWQCGVSTDGKLEVALLRTFFVDQYIDYDGIDWNEVGSSLQLWMECHSSFDGTKIILGVQLYYQIGSTAHKRGFINVIDVDTGSGTQFLRNHSKVEFIAGLCASTVDSKFAAVLGRCVYVWDIDAGPAMPLHRIPSPDFHHFPFGFSRSMFLDTANDSLVRGLPTTVISNKLSDGSEHTKIVLPAVYAITLSLPLQRLAVSLGTRIAIYMYEAQSWTQTISWGEDPPPFSTDPVCYFLEFGPGGSDVLGCYPLIKTVIVWNSLTGEMIRQFDGIDRLSMDSVRWCAVSNLLLSQSDGSMKIFDSTSGEELCCWKAHEERAALSSIPPAVNILL
jgi:WD40 repeat protein